MDNVVTGLEMGIDVGTWWTTQAVKLAQEWSWKRCPDCQGAERWEAVGMVERGTNAPHVVPIRIVTSNLEQTDRVMICMPMELAR